MTRWAGEARTITVAMSQQWSRKCEEGCLGLGDFDKGLCGDSWLGGWIARMYGDVVALIAAARVESEAIVITEMCRVDRRVARRLQAERC